MPIAAAWFADAIVGPQARRVTQVRANDRDVTGLELNLLDQLIIVIDIKGSVHCVPLSRSLGVELLPEETDNAA